MKAVTPVTAFRQGQLTIKAIKLHDFGPGLDEINDKPLLSIVLGVDFSDCSQFRIGTKDQVHRRGCIHKFSN